MNRGTRIRSNITLHLYIIRYGARLSQIGSEERPQPVGGHAAAPGIVGQSFFADTPYGEVAHGGMTEHQSGHGGCGLHHAVFRQVHADVAEVDEAVHQENKALVGQRRIAHGGPAPLIGFSKETLGIEVLVGGIAPVGAAHGFMQAFGGGLGHHLGVGAGAQHARPHGQLKIEKRVRAKVIAFYGVKGGVGTTSIVANVAAALASRGKKVILLDFDLQYGDSNLFLDVESKDTIVELARDPEGISIEKVNAAAATHSTGFSILCPPKTPEYADYITPEHTRKIIENVRPYFEYILIDMGTNFAETTLVALENCDEIQVITNLNVPCLKGTKAVMNVLDTLRVADKAKLVITKNRSSLIKIKDFENLMLRKAYATITSDRNISDNAMNSGNPVVLNSPRSAIAKDYNKYVDQIVADKDNI